MKLMNTKSFGLVLTALGFVLGIYGFINLMPYGWILTLLGIVAILYGGNIREEKESSETTTKHKSSKK